MRNELEGLQPGMKSMIRQSHKGLTGMAMFCRYCNRVLDFRKAVNVSMSNEKGMSSLMMCVGCWDEGGKGASETLSKDNPTWDVSFVDGREL